MTLTFAEALAYATSRRVVLPEEYYDAEQSASRSRAFSIAGVASRDQLQGVLDSLAKVSKEGMTFDQWKAMVKGGDIKLGLPDYRLDNIFRTNMQSAYSVGHWKQQQRNKDRRPYLMYDAINDTRVRPSHLKLDNIIRPVDDAFWDEHYPPNGYRCRCSVISLTAAQAEARGGVTEEPAEGWPKTDKGWDYNPGTEPAQGIKQAMEPTQGGSPQVQRAMEAQKEVAMEPQRVATEKDIQGMFGTKVAKVAKPMVQEAVELFSKDGRKWDASIFEQKLAAIRDSLPASGEKWAGLYTAQDRTIDLNMLRTMGRPGTLIHEVGHHIDFALLQHNPVLRTSMLEEFVALKEVNTTAKTISEYALRNEHEWIAECFRAYVETPQLLQLNCPKAYAAFERFRVGGSNA